MFPWTQFFTDSAIYVAAFTAVVLVSFLWKPRLWVHDLPTDIQAMAGPKTPLERRQTRLLGVVMIPVLLANASQLWSAIRDNFYTDIPLEQLIQLGLFIKDLSLESIKRGVIDFSYLSNYTTASGAAVLIPNRARLGGLMIEVFGTNYSE